MQSNTREDYFRLKTKKLDEQLNNIPIDVKSNLLTGMIFYINGMTDPPPFKLQQLIREHNGKYCVSRFQKFTHVISTSLSNSSINSGSYRGCPVLKPEWLIDTIESNKIIDMTNYQLNIDKKHIGPSIKTFFDKSTDTTSEDLLLLKSSTLMNDCSNKNIDVYFEKSRLHHLSTLKNHFKRNCLKNFTQKHKTNNTSTKMIAHFDMDCFFVAASIAKLPNLIDKPVAVTHANNKNIKSTSNIASCNYVARKYGLKNGMFVRNAYELCPDLICVPYDFNMIKLIAEKFFQILCDQFTLVYPLSCDEALVDITDDYYSNENIESKICTVRKLIYDTTNCYCSVGCSSSTILCRYLLKKSKPNGQQIVYPKDNVNFIEELSIKDLTLVDDKSIELLADIECVLFGDIKYINFAMIEKVVGNKLATKLVEFSKGNFDTDDQNLELKLTTQKKSVSINYNFGIRFTNVDELYHLLKSLSNELYSRMLGDGIHPVLLTLKIMVRKPNAPIKTFKHGGHGLCDVISSSLRFRPLEMDSISSDVIFRKSQEIVMQHKFDISDLRGVALSLKNKLHTNNTKFGGTTNMTPSPSSSSSIIQSFFNPTINTHPKKYSSITFPNNLVKIKSSIQNNKLSIVELVRNKSSLITLKRKFINNITKFSPNNFDQHAINDIINDLDVIVQMEEYATLFQFRQCLFRHKDVLEPNMYMILDMAINDRLDVYKSSRR